MYTMQWLSYYVQGQSQTSQSWSSSQDHDYSFLISIIQLSTAYLFILTHKFETGQANKTSYNKTDPKDLSEMIRIDIKGKACSHKGW